MTWGPWELAREKEKLLCTELKNFAKKYADIVTYTEVKPVNNHEISKRFREFFYSTSIEGHECALGLPRESLVTISTCN